MSSMPELLSKLAEREKERLAAELEGNARIRETADRVNKAAEELMQLRRAQEQEMRVLKAQYEKRIRDTGYASRQKVHQAQSEVAQAEGLAERAEQRQQAAEIRVLDLEQKVAQLRAHLQMRTQNAEASIASLERMMQVRADRTDNQCDLRVKDMIEHAQTRHRECWSSLGNVEDELADQTVRAKVRHEARICFKELTQIAAKATNNEITQEMFRQQQAERLALWQEQKMAYTPKLSPVSTPALSERRGR